LKTQRAGRNENPALFKTPYGFSTGFQREGVVSRFLFHRERVLLKKPEKLFHRPARKEKQRKGMKAVENIKLENIKIQLCLIVKP
jgi:hypothetical protein